MRNNMAIQAPITENDIIMAGFMQLKFGVKTVYTNGLIEITREEEGKYSIGDKTITTVTELNDIVSKL